ncbi:undecaprenyl-phosphate galactose phosphotransferase/putative colanic acid biosysnthesis UDP-glucose lipid carrier transferase [Lutibacter oricola]|uniref:Undecaprenyl-phosphate galactose phosphotransferase/putative colanic acid biosysnthesis UDP-glucose lipid carrier transferase n=1 Tax=Lutibacter oricola TaxID=762486 RepID=A0A1H2TQY5_9FLAO|nr:undecaprenyl-phosphate glucose phosphotransferase [Lutibacter oricola]SDW46300.1 undecaprenyl-phosphate galactose phosphotransferase/putative colanic acid biosysnthesis UDP-glucose lipid carrier transferase [Lutibacter oricola]
MFKGKNRFQSILLFILDLSILISSFYLASFISFGDFNPNYYYYSLLLGWGIIWVGVVLKYNLYEVPRILYVDKVLSKNFSAITVFIVLSAAAIYFFTSYKFSRIFFITVVSLFSFLLLIFRILFLYLVKSQRLKKDFRKRGVIIVGMNQNIQRLISRVYSRPQYAFFIEGIFTDTKLKGRLKNNHKGGLDDVKDYLLTNNPKEVVISLPHSYGDYIDELIHIADNNLVRVRVVPEFSEYLSQRFSIKYVENVPVMKFRKEPMQSLSNRILKRSFDIVFSLMAVVFIFSWLFPIIALIIKLTSKGPVFFSQERTGQDNVSFMCLKFRSMVVNTDSDNLQATKNDSRVTPFGSFMRKTSIDELPQIINVLFNQMSLVGPRPHMLKHTEEYRVLVNKFMVRHFAKPGVTGWAQILGFRGETKTVKDMEKRANADIWYIENWSFMLDLKIIFRTVFGMLFKRDKNAY